VDSLATGKNLGRGVFIRGNHARNAPANLPKPPRVRLRIPCDLPLSVIDRAPLRLFNAAFYWSHSAR